MGHEIVNPDEFATVVPFDDLLEFGVFDGLYISYNSSFTVFLNTSIIKIEIDWAY